MKKINGSFCSVHSADKLLDVSESRMVTAYGIRSNVCSAVGALDFSPIASARRGSRKKHLGGLAPLNFPSPPLFPTPFPSPPVPLNF